MKKAYDIEVLQKLAKPIVDYLNEYCNPYCTVIITQSEIKLDVTQFGIPQEISDDNKL